MNLAKRRAARLLVGMVLACAVMGPAAHGGAADTAFTYQGQLKQNGAPANGPFDFEFRLFDLAEGGAPQGAMVPKDDVLVENGLITVDLDFGQVFDGNRRWLEVRVRDGAGTGDFTPLTPRQELTAAPYALYALGGPGGSGPWQASGANIFNTNAGNVGIGTSDPRGRLDVVGASPQMGTGTITSVGTQVNGVGTMFSSALRPGDMLIVGAQQQMVMSVLSNTSLAIQFPFSPVANNSLYKFQQPVARLHNDATYPALQITSNIRMGIGTETPESQLHIVGDTVSLRLQHNGGPTGFTMLEDRQPTQMKLQKANSSGTVFMDLNPMPTDGVNNASVRFFRETNTTGLKRVVFHKGDSTASASAVISVDGADSYFQADGGNVGIGTTTPAAKLGVISSGGTAPAIAGDGYWGVYGLASDPAGYGGVFSGSGFLGSGRSLFVFGESHLSGDVGVGNANPAARLHVTGGTSSAPGGGGHVVVGNVAGANISIDANDIMARNNGAISPLQLNVPGGDVVIGGALRLGHTIVTGDSDAVCPVDKLVVGGGCNLSANASITDSYPLNNGWHCSASPNDCTAACDDAFTVLAYAICLSIK